MGAVGALAPTAGAGTKHLQFEIPNGALICPKEAGGLHENPK